MRRNWILDQRHEVYPLKGLGFFFLLVSLAENSSQLAIHAGVQDPQAVPLGSGISDFDGRYRGVGLRAAMGVSRVLNFKNPEGVAFQLMAQRVSRLGVVHPYGRGAQFG